MRAREPARPEQKYPRDQRKIIRRIVLQHLPICEKSTRKTRICYKSLCINLITRSKDMKNNL